MTYHGDSKRKEGTAMEANVQDGRVNLAMSREEFSILLMHVAIGNDSLQKLPTANAEQKQRSQGLTTELSNLVDW